MPKLPPLFSERSVPEWIALFQSASSAEDRIRGLQAINALCPAEEARRLANQALTDADPTVRALAARLVGNNAAPLSADLDARLQCLLNDDDPDVRFESARALLRCGSVQADQAISKLIAFLDEQETDALMMAAVVSTIVDASPNFSRVESELLPRLSRLIDHERAEVREAVACAFARWPQLSRACSPQLLPLLDDSEPLVREKIALALGQSGLTDDAIKAALSTAANDDDVEVARVAAEALQRLTSPPSSA